jgi:peptide/nickel transport system substrate-binding protein
MVGGANSEAKQSGLGWITAGLKRAIAPRIQAITLGLRRCIPRRPGWRPQPILRRAIALVLTLGAIAFSGCSLDQFRVESAQIPRLIIAVTTDPKSFNYALNQSSPNVFSFIYDGLVGQNPLTSEIYPALAESWEISDDRLQITFTLRENLQWSDGEPLTVEDVVFSFNDVYLNPDIPVPIRDAFRIGQSQSFPEVAQISDRQVQFTIPEPFAPFLEYVGGTPILPAHALQDAVNTRDENGDPLFLSTWGTGTNPRDIIGNGPYRMVSYTPSERLIFERNPYYWQTDDQGRSQPYIDQFIWQIVESPDTSLIQFRSGGVDMLDISAQTFMLLKREEERGNFTIHEGGPDTSTFFVCLNLNQGRRQNGTPVVDPIRSAWFNDVRFRQAIAHAINRPKMLNNTFLGLGELLNSPIPVQSPFHLPPEEGLPVYDYDPERSRQLLEEAGFTYNAANQLFDAEGNRVRFRMITNTGGRVATVIGPQIGQDLAAIGIQVDFQALEFNTLLDRLRNSLDWDSYIGAITGGLEPHGASTIWALDGSLHTFNRQPQPGQEPLVGQTFADWEREIADLFVQGGQELDLDRRREIYGRAQVVIQENLPFIYLINPYGLGAIRNTVAGVEYSAIPTWRALWNINELRLTEQADLLAQERP